jgi:hypothetical protein
MLPRKQLVFGALVLAMVCVGLFRLAHVELVHSLPGPTEHNATNTAATASVTRESKHSFQGHANDGLERFRSEILPIADDFGRRIASLSGSGVNMPPGFPIQVEQVSKLRFAGGRSNTVCTFNVGGHSHFGCHVVNRGGKVLKGVNSFSRSGTDEAGVPRDFVQLSDRLKANPLAFESLGDTSTYPERAMQEVEQAARQVLAAVCPECVSSYIISEAWREQAGAIKLPFYLFAFTRNGDRKSDPSNLMRDEIMIGLKSTADGLVLDFFENSSIAFAGRAGQLP